MTSLEKYAWGSLISTGLILLVFKSLMLNGWQIIDQSGGALIRIYLAIIVLSVLAESLVAIVTARYRKGGVERDERDREIERRADQYSSWFMAIILNIIIVQTLATAAFDHAIFSGVSGALALNTPAQVFFVLFSTLIGAKLVEHISTIIMYRQMSAAG